MSVEGYKRIDIYVCQTVAVGHAEWLVGGQQVTNTLETAASQRFVTGIDQSNAPRRQRGGTDVVDLLLREIDRHIRPVKDVIREIFLDDVALVPETDDEVVKPVLRVEHHNVPQNWRTADLDHRLRFHLCLLADASSKSTGKQHNFHTIGNFKR